jgi:hypothetical protein
MKSKIATVMSSRSWDVGMFGKLSRTESIFLDKALYQID